MRENKPDTLAAGTVLNNRYVLGKALGSGGFGIIYLAYDTEFGRKVAVKEYFPLGIAVRTPDRVTIDSISYRLEEDFKKGKERFFSESELLLHLGGRTDVIGVYDVFAANGTAYYVMQYVDGLTISEYVKRYGRINSNQALFIGMKISSAFVFLHEQGIIHRDLSPDNVMITEDGDVRLVDFGNARPFSADGENSITVALKQGYAPLEQYQHYGNQGPWTDIYSLGAVIYYALTLKKPQDPMTRMEDDSELYAELSAADARLAAVISKMLAIKTETRYAGGAEILADLERIGISGEKLTRK